ncbi:MAG: DUF2809 domain-containing protein [Vicinamibacterales bacterium]
MASSGWSSARASYAVLVVVTMAVGLMVHEHGTALSPVVRDVLGDALWAAMVVWGFGVIAPAMPRLWRGAAAVAVAFSVEFSQLLHFQAIDALRRTTIGSLVLGSGFDPRDFAAYTAGALVAVLIDMAVTRRWTDRFQP